MAVGSSTPSPPSLGDRKFVVVNREEEEEVKKKMISLWKKQGKAGEGDWVRELYIDKTRNRQVPLPHPLLHYCQYVPLDCTSGSISGAKSRVTFQLRGKEKGRGKDVGTTCQRQ
jgi:hypothetical protein